MKNSRLILIPFSWLYGIIVRQRNRYYLSSDDNRFTIPVPSIVVGNLNLGGTGKTPFTEFLISEFDDSTTAFLSRGYGRKTKGYLKVTKNASSDTVGDEPLQMMLKAKEAHFHVCEDRTTGIKTILKNAPDTRLIILDDAYQHLKVKAQFYCLITRFDKLFYNDFIIPVGNLRENRKGAERANAIIISKCPLSLTKSIKEKIILKIAKYSSAPVYFSTINYSSLNTVTEAKLESINTCLLTGIVSDQPIKDHLNSQGIKILKHFRFKDHHNFSLIEIKAIVHFCLETNSRLITTEKDWMRLSNFSTYISGIQIQTLPIKTEFLFDEQDLFMKQLRSFTIN
jgi:tetraacyldisaccharide 4'-kinase